MLRATTSVAVTAALLVAAPTLSARATPERSPAILTTSPAIQASLDRIASGSASWRHAMLAVSRSGRHVLVVTPDRVAVAEGPNRRRVPFDPNVLAEVAHVPTDGPVDSVLVVVNVALVERLHRSKGSLPAEEEADLDRIVVHEVYGHAIPYLLAGGASGQCADPAAGRPAAESCSIERENVVRAELGLGRRTDYGLNGLFLARR
jgi:hypothetical protein